MARRPKRSFALLALLAMLAGMLPGVAGAQSRDLASYVLFALDEIRTKGIDVIGNGNIGVNNPSGLLSASSHGEIDGPGSQVVADEIRASVDSRCAPNGLFANLVFRSMTACGPARRVTLPIVANPAQACGSPISFPACGRRTIVVLDGAVVQLAPDPAGYGDVRVMGGGKLVLTGGSYVFCSLRAGRNAVVSALAPATVSIAGAISLGNATFLGSDPAAQPPVGARDLKLLVNGTTAHFSGSADVHATVCAPNARLRVTHGATLEGSFLARTIRTERITVTPPGGGTGTTSTTTSSNGTTSSTRTTTTSTPGSTTTTTMPDCVNDRDRLCGNGHIDCDEECDGTDFGDATCPGRSDDSFLECKLDCTLDESRCPCGNGVREAGEECDPAAGPTGCAADKVCGPVAERATACRCVPPPAEICGNCIDDNDNGLTDFEDPACCPRTKTFVMSVTHGRLRPRGARSKLVLHSLLAASGLEKVNPLKQDVFVQIRQPGGAELLCAKAPAMKFMRMHKAFKFWDRKHRVASARGIQDIKVKVRKNRGVRFKTFGLKVEMATPPRGPLQVTVGFHDPAGDDQNACSTQVQAFRTGRKGRLLAP